MPQSLVKAESKSFIYIEGARVHNLKNVSLAIPANKLVVITGLSGSGKSSLAFDTLYAEGRRRFVESLSSYARQFLGKQDRPDVDAIRGISPAIALEQKTISSNPRSSVGTVTELAFYFQLLYAKLGQTVSPVSGKVVKRHTVTDIVEFVSSMPEGERFMVLAVLDMNLDKDWTEKLETLKRQGYVRLLVDGAVYEIQDSSSDSMRTAQSVCLIVDRVTVSPGEDFEARLADSAETAFFESAGNCRLYFPDSDKQVDFSNKFESDGIRFEEPGFHFFSPNNPVGACKRCGGYGMVIGIDENLVIPDKSLSVFSNAVVCWRGAQMSEWKELLVRRSEKMNFPIHTPISELSPKEFAILWEGNKDFEGIMGFFRFVEQQAYKIQYRVMLSRFRGKTKCPECKGTKLRMDASYVKVQGRSIMEWSEMPLKTLSSAFGTMKWTADELAVGGRIVKEILQRLAYLNRVGLGYLTMNRQSMTLSGGESQRVNLASTLGNSLVGSMYILDEPSIGLHPRDTERLISVLKELRDIGNTVIVVEHDQDVMMAADHIIDLGPEAGTGGGRIMFSGPPAEIVNSDSLTSDYLTGKRTVNELHVSSFWSDSITVNRAAENNLKAVDFTFPLRVLTCVTGVSGSGKSTLVRQILYPALSNILGISTDKPGLFSGLSGDLRSIKHVEMVDQNPIGKSARSNPVSYIKAFDDIRQLFANTAEAKVAFLPPGHFSFNVAGGRCETCEGEGKITVEMQFMADVKYTCESCQGKRYKEEVLEVKHKGKNIFEVLELTVDEAIIHFSQDAKSTQSKRVIEKLDALRAVGMGYIKLGQASNTLSGGEAQRIKLAAFFALPNQGHTVFIFDEPTTGLHFHDVGKLLVALRLLVSSGHTVIVVEHHPDVIRNADWLIDLGPESGEDGGELVYAGIPSLLASQTNSITGRYLKPKLIH